MGRSSQTVAAAAVFLAVAVAPAEAQLRFGADRDSRPRGEARPAAGLLVQFRSGVLDADQRRAIADAGGRLGLKLGLVRGFSVNVGEGSLEALRERLRAAPGVLRVEDNVPMAVAKNPDDPGFDDQYALADSNDDDIDAPAAWNDLTGCAKVAVLDTGIQLDHPDLKSNLWKNSKESNNGRDDDGNGYIDDVYGVDIVTGRGSGDDHNGHGTHVAGIIGARGDNDRGISGLCWKTNLVAVRILDAEGRGYVAQQVAGIEYALRVGAKVINCSFGGPDSSPAMRDAIAEAGQAGSADRRRRRQRRRRRRREAVLSGRLPGKQRALRRRHRQPRPARLVLQLRRDDGGPGRARRRCRFDVPGIEVRATCRVPAWPRRTSRPPPPCCASTTRRGMPATSAPVCATRGTSCRRCAARRCPAERLNVNRALG